MRGLTLLLAAATLRCASSSDLNSDADGVSGGKFTFVVTATDEAFRPNVIKAQNRANVTVTLNNAGTRPHGFRVQGVDASTIAPLAPGASAALTFMTPDHEAIYVIDSQAPGDTMQAQLVVQ